MAGLAAKSTLLALALVALNLGGIAALKQPKKSMEDKHDYTVEIQRVEVVEVSNEFFQTDTFSSSTLLNEDMRRALYKNMTTLNDISPNTMVGIVTSRMDLITNEWVEKFHLHKEFCEFIKDADSVTTLFKDTNFPRKCPIPAGEYYFKDITIDNSEFPKHMEVAEWRADFNIYDKNSQKCLLRFIVYAEIVELDEI